MVVVVAAAGVRRLELLVDGELLERVDAELPVVADERLPAHQAPEKRLQVEAVSVSGLHCLEPRFQARSPPFVIR